MPQFGDLPLAILRSISAASGDMYRDVHDPELTDELSRRGYEPDKRTLVDAMHALKDAGYVECTFVGASGISFIRLDHRGRQEVEGWPTSPGSLSATDVEALVATLQARGDDPTVTEPERSKAQAAASALRDLGLSVTGQVIVAWLKQLGVA